MPFNRVTIDSDEEEEGGPPAPAAAEEQDDVPALDEPEEEHAGKETSATQRKAGSKKSSNADDEEEEDEGEGETDELASTSKGRSGDIDRSNFIPSSVVPSSLRGLRACLLCALVKTADQFEASGCDNCEKFLQLRSNRSAVLECTSSSFDGLVMLMSPSESWVAKWLRWDRGCVPGAYAVSVTGQLPPEIISELEEHGYRYVSRDTSLRA